MASKYEKELINWEYGKCDLHTAPSDFGPFSDLVSLWQDKRLGDGLPARADFDFPDFKGWWGRIAIVKFETDPFNVRFVLWGTQLTEWWGVDYTNSLLGEKAASPEAWLAVEGKYFLEMVQTPFIGLVKGYLDQYQRPHRRVLGVDLPLSDGERVTHAILAHREIYETETFEELIPDNPVQTQF